MKTNLFYHVSRNIEGAKRLLTDLNVLIGMKKEHREACIKILTAIANQAMTEHQRRQLIQGMVDTQIDMEFLKALSATQALQFLAGALLDDKFKGDKTADLAEDLVVYAKTQELESISAEEANIFAEVINTLRKRILPEYKDAKDKRLTVEGVLPSLNSFGTTVELRAIVKNPFPIGMMAKDYKPDITGLIPVVSVKLGTDSGVPDEFSFQASKEEFQVLIEEFNSALVVLENLEKYSSVLQYEQSSDEEDRK